MAEIGYSTIGGTAEAGGHVTGFPAFSQFTAGSSFSATRVLCYTRGQSGSVGLTFGIYADEAGVPGNKLGETSEVTATTTPDWYTADLDSPVSIVNGTTYWLAVSTSAARNLYYDSGSYSSRFLNSFAYVAGDMPGDDPSTTSWYTDRRMSIYADDGGADATPPTLSSWATNTDGDEITATLSEAGCGPASGTGGFTLGGTSATVSSWAISGTTLTLTLSGTIYQGETVTVSYDDGTTTDDIVDAATNKLADITNASVTNNSTQLSDSTPRIVFEGDSLTYGFNASTGAGTVAGAVYPKFVMDSLGSGWAGTNHGTNGDTWADLETDAATVDGLQAASATNLLVVFCGVNDIGGGRTAQQVYDDTASYCADRQAAGWIVVLISIPPNAQIIGSAAFNAVRNAANALYDDNWRTFADGYVAIHLDDRIGQDGDENDTTYFHTDDVHFTDAGYEVLGNLVAGALGAAVYQGGAGGAASSILDGGDMTGGFNG